MPTATEDQVVTYIEPDDEYVMMSHRFTINEVRVGDYVRGTRVEKIIRGHKYITLQDEHERTILRGEILADEEHGVGRRTQTKESRDAQRRWLRNMNLVRALANWKSDRAAARQALKERLDGEYSITYGDYDSILLAEARAEVWAGYAAVVDFMHNLTDTEHELYGGDHFDAYESYCESLKDRFFNQYSNGALSRSSNQMSNLIEDVVREERMKFIARGETYYW